nr:hypothetical protein [Tanacetum cinerariifolium]
HGAGVGVAPGVPGRGVGARRSRNGIAGVAARGIGGAAHGGKQAGGDQRGNEKAVHDQDCDGKKWGVSARRLRLPLLPEHEA